jgi:hypothetical protein
VLSYQLRGRSFLNCIGSFDLPNYLEDARISLGDLNLITRLDHFLQTDDSPYREVPGEHVEFNKFYDAFVAQLRPNEVPTWSKRRMKFELGATRPVGPGPQNVVIVGNVSDKRKTPRPYVLKGGKVRLE